MSSFVLLDAQVPDIEALIAGLEIHAQIVLANHEEDGVTQIVSLPSGVTDPASSHIVSQGTEGKLYIGEAILAEDNLCEYPAELCQTGSNLAASGDILLYGGAAGIISEGDLPLETPTSSIESAAAFHADVAADYSVVPGHAFTACDESSVAAPSSLSGTIDNAVTANAIVNA